MTTSLNTSRSQIALLRPPRERAPMSTHKRRALESRSFVTSAMWGLYHSVVRGCCRANNNDRAHVAANPSHRRFRSDLDVDSPCEDGDEDDYDRPQYTLKSVKIRTLSSLRRLTSRCTSRKNQMHYYTDAESNLRWDVNSLISSYLSFSHRTSYFLLFLLFSAVYYANILMFAFVYWAFSAYYPECVTSAGVEIGSGEGSDLFGDSFVLSWTTFSTVGYGSIYPSTGANSDEALPRKCMIVGIIGSFEAFVGVLYAGFCTAVLFGKVIRSQNQAQVYFSDPLVIRYGKQELLSSDKTTDRRDEESQDVEVGETLASIEESRVIDQKKNDVVNIPCPVMEFRIVNRLHDVEEGEIVEAQLDCVAIFDTSRIITTDSTHLGEYGIPQSSSNGHVDNHPEAANAATDNVSSSVPNNANNVNSRPSAIFHRQNRAITKLTLESNEHPYFRRVWFGRHILDENSPLLSELARTKIKQNGGYWPPELNNHYSIRDNLHFRHILVCFSGTSNANATSVYAQKVYDSIDVNVGYRFVPMNYHAETGELKTDSYLLNAISEQRGGGAEPFL